MFKKRLINYLKCVFANKFCFFGYVLMFVAFFGLFSPWVNDIGYYVLFVLLAMIISFVMLILTSFGYQTLYYYNETLLHIKNMAF